jgi:hypothetical protein
LSTGTLAVTSPLGRREGGSEKGMKDRVDILSLLVDSEVDLMAYAKLLEKHRLVGYLEELRKIVSQASQEMTELGTGDPAKARRIKRRLLSSIDGNRCIFGARIGIEKTLSASSTNEKAQFSREPKYGLPASDH